MKHQKNLAQFSDLELIELYQTSHEKSIIGYLYKRYLGLVYGICYKYLNNQHDAEDTTSEIFFLLMDKLSNNKIQNFKSWLYVFSKNHILYKLRRQGDWTYEYSEEIQDQFMEFDEEWHLNMDDRNLTHWEDDLKLGIESLKDAQQVCIELFYIQKKSYLEISELTGFDILQVKSHIQNGKRNLKKILESKGYKNGSSYQ